MSNQLSENLPNAVFVIDTNRKPLAPCRPVTARKLLKAGKASVFRQYPFTIILNKKVTAEPTKSTLKIDPGSKTTGIAILTNTAVVWAAELTHRGQQIKDSLESRRSLRRGRRERKTRYRQPRFLNRIRPKGWLPPSLQHRVDTLETWVNRIRKFCAIGDIAQELVRFDLQKLENPEISGIEYQQGELQGYEVREYLLEKWGRKCAYCGAKNVPLQIEHIHPRSKGGSNRISNLTIACEPCNQAKGSQDVKDFLNGKPDLLKRILETAKAPLKDAAAVNATRWTINRMLQSTGLPVTTGSGGQTKFNRTRLELPKTHWLDAACVGNVDSLDIQTTQPLLIKATGHGSRQVIHTDKYGFQRRNKKGDLVRKLALDPVVKGFQTGDICRAVVKTSTKLKTVGVYVGRVLVRTKGSFNLTTKDGTQQGISWRQFSLLHKKDGYNYAL